MRGGPDVSELLRFDLKTGAVRPLLSLKDVPVLASNFSLSTDGKSLLATASNSETEIWVLDGFQTPRTLWEKLWPRKQ